MKNETIAAAFTKENVLATMEIFAKMGVSPNFGRFTITNGTHTYGASQIGRSILNQLGLSAKEEGLHLPRMVALLNEIGVPVTDLGERNRKRKRKSKPRAAKTLVVPVAPVAAAPVVAPVIEVAAPVAPVAALDLPIDDLVKQVSALNETLLRYIKRA